MSTAGTDRKVWCHQPLMPRSNQIFLLVPTVTLLGVMFIDRCWPTTFHTITVEDANGWCQNWPVWSAPHAPITPKFPYGPIREIDGDYVHNQMLAHHISHYCYSRRWQRMVSKLRPIPTLKLLRIMLRNRYWPTTLHTINSRRRRRMVQWSGRFLGIITGWNHSVCKSNRLHVHILHFSFTKPGYIL